MKTVGDIVDEYGPCLLMTKVVELAEQHSRIPVRRWQYRFQTAPGTVLYVNGDKAAWHIGGGAVLTLAPWSAALCSNDWPMAVFDSAGGSVVGCSKEALIAIFDRELSVNRD